MSRPFSTACLFSVMLLGLTTAAPLAKQQGEPDEPGLAQGFVTDKASVDISGIACQPETTGQRVCVVIDDQGQSAQVAFFRDGKLTRGPLIKLIDEDGKVLGTPPSGLCKGKPKFKDLDGEGVAYAAPYFYVVGSHGCGRKKGKFNPSAYITARFKLDPQGRRLDASGTPVAPGADWSTGIQSTHRLADALRNSGEPSGKFGEQLDDEGMNVEGVAVLDGVLLAGLRAPSKDKDAFLVLAKIDDLFAPGARPLAEAPHVSRLHLGKNVGIRDLSVLPDGSLVGMSGPTEDDKDTKFGVFLVKKPLSSEATFARIELADVPRPEKKPAKCDCDKAESDETPERAKAEAILPLSLDGTTLTALIMFDGLENGGARLYHLDLSNPGK